MIKGTGIDIVEIDRLKGAIEKWGDLFLKRVFTDTEVAYSMEKRFPFQHLAARFAAKEAIMKAFGTEFIGFKDIEISNDTFGRPHCTIRNKKDKVHISVAHSDKYAVASAIV